MKPKPDAGTRPAVRADSGRRGAILGVAALVTLLVSVLGISILGLASLNTVETARMGHLKQAFWLAEAGLECVKARLWEDAAYRDAPTAVTGGLGRAGAFAVAVSHAGPSYTLTSTGSVRSMTRRLRLFLDVQESGWPRIFSDYALFGAGDLLQVKEDVLVNGSVFYDGKVTLEDGTTITDMLYVTGDLDAAEGASYTLGELPEPLPEIPPLDTSPYDDELANASAHRPRSRRYGNLDLSRGTVYVNGDVAISRNSTVSGPGTLVATKSLTLESHVTLNPDVTLICGEDMLLNEGLHAGSNTVLYATKKVDIKESSIVFANSSVVTPGIIESKVSFQFAGVMYAGEKLHIKENSTIEGSLVCGGQMDVMPGSTVTHDPSQFGKPPPGFEGELAIEVVKWEQL